jgi:hypothetical protein
MRDYQSHETALEFFRGLIVAIVGIALIAIAGWQPMGLWVDSATYVAGFAAFFGGMAWIWRDLRDSAALPVGDRLQSEGHHLGTLRLNSHLFEAYERQVGNGSKEFRLVSTPMVSAEREAACIRYLVNEGLIEELWPQMSERIAQEANWAFFA